MFLAKKDYFYLAKKDIYVEMVLSRPILPQKKRLAITNCPWDSNPWAW